MDLDKTLQLNEKFGISIRNKIKLNTILKEDIPQVSLKPIFIGKYQEATRTEFMFYFKCKKISVTKIKSRLPLVKKFI